MVGTSRCAMPDGRPTGAYASELIDVWQILTGAGASIDLGSPDGGAMPIEARRQNDPAHAEFFAGAGGSAVLSTRRVADLIAESGEWDLVVILGGHGAIMDLAIDKNLAELVSRCHEQGCTVAAVCHGVAGLLGAMTAGAPLVRGRSITAFTDEEELAVGMIDRVPYCLSDALQRLGADYRSGPPFLPHVVVDERLVTGQNPASAGEVARRALAGVMDVRRR